MRAGFPDPRFSHFPFSMEVISVLDYIISLLSGQHMNGVDYGAVGGFMLYKVAQRSIKRIMRKVETIIVIYIAIFIGYKLYQYMG